MPQPMPLRVEMNTRVGIENKSGEGHNNNNIDNLLKISRENSV